MLVLFAILLILWLLGVISNNTFDGLIHLLLVVGLIALVLSAVDKGSRRSLNLNKNLGMVLAGIWFILTGLFSLVGLSFQGQAIVMAVLALIAGVLLLLDR